MSEGRGELGDGEEENVGAPAAFDARSSASEFAAALAAEQAKRDPAVAEALKALFRTQTDEISEQRSLRLAQLRNQNVESQLRRVGQTIRICLQLVTAFLFALVGLGLAVMIADAFNSRTVIVDQFDAPPALAARGMTGTVVAGQVLDELTRLQAATRSAAAKRNLSSAWTGDIKVELPNTGASLGEINRLLHQRFGHDLHIGGALTQSDTAGLALTVRGDGILPKTFRGGVGDLDGLTSQAAEYVYGQSEPWLLAVYLSNNGRVDDAKALIVASYGRASPEERPYLLNAWANALVSSGGTVREQLRLYRRALKLKPNYWVAHNNVINANWLLGNEEDAWREGVSMRQAAGGRPGKAPELYYQNWDTLTWNLNAWRTSVLADQISAGGIGTGTTSEGPVVADIDVRLHDPGDAEFQLVTAHGDAGDPTISAMSHFVHGRIAAEAGDNQRAASEMEAFAAAYADPRVSSNYPGYNCWVAPVKEAAGHAAQADAALVAGGHFVDCYRFHADILDHRGDWRGAQRAYDAAVAVAPDLPAAYYSWGLALARHGELSKAVDKLKLANEHGPYWADPLKAWGDILASQGHWTQALTKYRQALKLAPGWAELQKAETAAMHKVMQWWL